MMRESAGKPRWPHHAVIHFAAFAALTACTTPARTDPGDGCGLAAVDTAGWQPLTSRHGTFGITLPAGASEVPLPCIDSPCGQITVGAMVIGYDSGPMAGSGEQVTQLDGTVIDRECRVGTADGRTFSVGLGRYTSTMPTWRPTVELPDAPRRRCHRPHRARHRRSLRLNPHGRTKCKVTIAHGVPSVYSSCCLLRHPCLRQHSRSVVPGGVSSHSGPQPRIPHRRQRGPEYRPV